MSWSDDKKNIIIIKNRHQRLKFSQKKKKPSYGVI